MHLIQSLKNEFCFDLPMFSKYPATSINSYFYKMTLIRLIRCCTVPRKILISQKSFATQHSFATHSVQLRYKGLLLMMVVFDHGHFS